MVSLNEIQSQIYRFIILVFSHRIEMWCSHSANRTFVDLELVCDVALSVSLSNVWRNGSWHFGVMAQRNLYDILPRSFSATLFVCSTQALFINFFFRLLPLKFTSELTVNNFLWLLSRFFTKQFFCKTCSTLPYFKLMRHLS